MDELVILRCAVVHQDTKERAANNAIRTITVISLTDLRAYLALARYVHVIMQSHVKCYQTEELVADANLAGLEISVVTELVSIGLTNKILLFASVTCFEQNRMIFFLILTNF
jgi:hypothetical protein